jgi:hypothetical protein
MKIQTMESNNLTHFQEVSDVLFSELELKLQGKKCVKQSETNLFKNIKPSYVGLGLAGIYCIEVTKSKDKNISINSILRVLSLVWNYIALILLVFYSITTLISVLLTPNSRLTLFVDFLTLSSSCFRSLVLRAQRHKIKVLINDIQESLNLFPEVSIRKINYLKAVIITLFYSTIQGKNILEISLYSESKLYFFFLKVLSSIVVLEIIVNI